MRLAFLALVLPFVSACSLVESFDGYVKDAAVDGKVDTASAEDTSADLDEGTLDGPADEGTPTDTGSLVDTRETCPATQSTCGGVCVSTDDDPKNCGACGVVCSTTKGPLAVCSAGKCACPSDTQDCGICTRTATDPLNCGICGRIVDRSQQCVLGTPVCRPGTNTCSQWMTTGGSTVTCDDKCTDIRGDGWHCVDPLDGSKSRCYNDTTPIRCVTGKCYSNACPSGRSECTTGLTNSRSCFYLDRDANHCGSCTNKCAAGDICVTGTCVKYRVAKACTECVGELAKCCSGASVPATWDHEIVCLPATSSCPS